MQTKLFKDLTIGTWFRFPTEHYKNAVFMKTKENFDTLPFRYNSVWIRGKHSGHHCHFTDDAELKIVPKKGCKR